MKNKHMSFSDRKEIEYGLKNKLSFNEISKIIGKDKTTVSKEIRKNSVTVRKGAVGRAFNDCIHKPTCNRNMRGLHCINCGTSSCNRCSICYRHCSKYIKFSCEKLQKPPYVCNSCSSRSKCTLEKKIYDSKQADSIYRSKLVESRQGILASPEEIDYLDKLLTPLIKDNNQPVYHILETYKDEIMWSEKTIRSYINKSVFEARNINLPRQVRFKPRKGSPHDNLKVDSKCRVGRTYEDYERFIENNEIGEIVQMDTVEGRRGGKVLLTLEVTSCRLLLAYLRDRNDSRSVTEWFEHIYRSIGHKAFSTLFELILTDNGSEFSNPSAIEFTADNRRRSTMFYCDPSKPYQKGSIENIHTKLRQVIPKGKSMDGLSQEKIMLMCNHINSVKRKYLNGKTPYEMFEYKYGVKTAKKLGLEPLNANKVVLNPSLLK